ncbi:hypothetical protein SKAU_G00080300 [Synaphobranchus kaupii]|uniref:Uncharacterized protein n=1 Tax=Synaphobranchus kaupii TaxID=118154 RepID=A0A9Q1FUZ5_SYNKA|nr:hypothetical protein SKAU_G00080300 [Synaphobranchus kaupii]
MIAVRVKCLDLQLAERQTQLESVSTERDVTERELGKAREHCQLLRWKSEQQVQALRTSVSTLHSCRQELQEVQRSHTHLLTSWKGWSAGLLQTSRDADAVWRSERAELQRAVGGARAEVTHLREELGESDRRLASSDTRVQELQTRAQNQEQLQTQFQEVQTQLLGLKEKEKSLHLSLQDSQSERERLETLLLHKSKETEELHFTQIQFEKEQRARLSEDKEKEERLLSCQQRCQSLQKELLDWERQEEEVTRKHTQVDSENRTLRTSLQQALEKITSLTEQSEKAALAHRQTTEQLAEELEQRAQIEDLLQRERVQADLRLKEKEQELRMEREMELHIEMEKSRELLMEHQREAEQLRKKLPSLVQTATQELRAEVAAAEETLREAREAQDKLEERREKEALRLSGMVSGLEQQLLQARGDGQEGALQLAQLRQELEQRREETSVLQEESPFNTDTGMSNPHKTALGPEALSQNPAHLSQRLSLKRRPPFETNDQSKNTLLQETVRRECEEREGLTAALTQAREELLELRRSPAHAVHLLGTRGRRSSTDGRTKDAEASGEGRLQTSWHGREAGNLRGMEVISSRSATHGTGLGSSLSGPVTSRLTSRFLPSPPARPV